MTDIPPIEQMGPPPFRFTPVNDVVEGPAFSLVFKALTTAIVGGCCAGMTQLWLKGGFASAATTGVGWFMAGMGLLLITWWYILRSRTRLDSQALYQSWIWDKKLELRELAYCKLIRVRGLEWLIAPRLYARTLMGKFSVFYAATPELVAEFERLIRELETLRRGR